MRKKATRKYVESNVEKGVEKRIKEGIESCCSPAEKCRSSCSSGGCTYFLGFLGAAIYYISTSTGFWNGVWGVIKALVWPAILVFEALKFMGV